MIDSGPDYIVYNIRDDPLTISEALSSPDSDLWRGVINNEIDSLMAIELGSWLLTSWV